MTIPIVPIRPGDLVTLRSGGPVLTAGQTRGAQTEVVWWYDGHVREAMIPTEALVRCASQADRTY